MAERVRQYDNDLDVYKSKRVEYEAGQAARKKAKVAAKKGVDAAMQDVATQDAAVQDGSELRAGRCDAALCLQPVHSCAAPYESTGTLLMTAPPRVEDWHIYLSWLLRGLEHSRLLPRLALPSPRCQSLRDHVGWQPDLELQEGKCGSAGRLGAA